MRLTLSLIAPAEVAVAEADASVAVARKMYRASISSHVRTFEQLQNLFMESSGGDSGGNHMLVI